MRLAAHAGLEVESAPLLGPTQIRRDEVEFGRDVARRSAAGRRDEDFRMIAFVYATDEGDQFAVGRPTRTVVFFVVVGDFSGGAACGVNDENVAVAALVERVARAVGDEGDEVSVG